MLTNTKRLNPIVRRIQVLFLCILCSFCMQLKAQNVTISPQSGHLISGKTTNPNERGYVAGYGSYWVHNQLPLTFTVSGTPYFTSNDVMTALSGGLKEYQGNLLIATLDFPEYACIALPRGYRIKSYTIVFKNDMDATADKSVLDEVWADPSLARTAPFGRIIDWKVGEVKRKDVLTGSNSTVPNFVPGTEITIPTNSVGQEFTMTRTADDIGNRIFFAFAGNINKHRVGVLRIKHIEIKFAADDTFDVPLTPKGISFGHVSLTESGFNVGKVDLGPITRRVKEGKTFYAYDANQLDDINASAILYNEGAVENGTWDATKGNKTISAIGYNSKYWYGIQEGTHYVEAPTNIKIRSGQGNRSTPIAYRIVGAKITADYGTASNRAGGFNIWCKYPDGTYYFLGTDGQWTTANTVTWHMDEDGRIYYIDYTNPASPVNKYLSWFYTYGTGSYTIKTRPSSSTGTDADSYYGMKWSFDDVGLYVYAPINGIIQKLYLRGTNDASQRFLFWNIYTTLPAVNRTPANDAFTPKDYKLMVYDKTGDNVLATANISAANTSQTINLSDLNNDAIKFKIASVNGDNPTALLQITLKLQPLNPYLSEVDAVCQGMNGEKITRRFGSTDFKLGGGAFIYKVPKGFVTSGKARFEFREAKSDYADDTYGPLSKHGNSRYSLVGSPYYTLVGNDLYGHKTDVMNYDYVQKITTDKVGNIPFYFNNAAELYNTNESSTGSYLYEQNFSMPAYVTMTGEVTTNKNGVISHATENGSFNAQNTEVEDLETKTMYLFAADETRYNIAPTTAEVHRAYAYYDTKITLQMAEYTPKVKWEKVYDTTDYLKDAAHKDHNEAMVGAKITTTESGYDYADLLSRDETSGYLTVNQIYEAMQSSINQHETGAPNDLSQVLYVDGSTLFSIVKPEATITEKSIDDLRTPLAKNALVYLPYRAISFANNTNTAIKVKDSADDFSGKGNIILTDKNPFFAPFSIQLDADKYAQFTRENTNTARGRTIYNSVVLPYGLTLDTNGKHSNPAGTTPFEFTLSEMKANGLSYDGVQVGSGKDYQATQQFKSLTSGKSLANMPYYVTNDPAYGSGNISFIAIENGARIEKTPRQDGLQPGATVTNTLEGTPTNFTSKYTYSGAVLPRATNGNVFYFSRDKYVALRNLRDPNLYVYPFRAVYAFDAGSVSPAKLFTSFVVSMDDFNSHVTGIDAVSGAKGLKIAAGKNEIAVSTDVTTPLHIVNIAGQTFVNTTLKAGSSATYHLPADVYLVNRQKVIIY